ncbi:MAG: hypothetical protein WKF67_07930, partial [Rubrobacteraceae bacterium]
GNKSNEKGRATRTLRLRVYRITRRSLTVYPHLQGQRRSPFAEVAALLSQIPGNPFIVAGVYPARGR